MGRVDRLGLGLFLLALTSTLAALSFAKGGLYTGRHEGDALHLMQIVLREAQGQWPHLDFLTPIGLFATAPVALFVKFGLGFGQAFLAAQALVALLVLPAVWHVASSRLRGGWAWLFGGFIVVLILALVHGETVIGVSVSMYYNRWAWALAYLAILPAVLPPLAGGRPGKADGVVIGLALTALALIKVTYLVSVLPAILVALILRRGWSAIGAGLLAGLILAASVTVWAGGFGFWLAYLGDLATVAQTPLRVAPGLPLGEVITTPAYLGGNMVLIASIIFLRQAGRSIEGLVLLLLAPGFVYVQYQNWGNDPQWLALLGFILVASRPTAPVRVGFGWDGAQALGAAAIAAFAFAAPPALNLAWSPLRHLNVDTATRSPLVPGSGVHEDLQTVNVRARRVNVTEPIDGPGAPLEGMIADSARGEVTEWNGEVWPDCELAVGLPAWLETMAAELNATGLTEGKAVFFADVVQAQWLYGIGLPLPGGAPWFYGGLAGIENADLVLVPRCAIHTKARGMVLDALDARGTALTEISRSEMYVLYAK